MAGRSPWLFVAAGAAATVIVLGYAGQLSGLEPIDRLLNPDARGYAESAEDYIQDIFDSCRATVLDLDAFKACYDGSLDEAIERGYLTEPEIAHSPAPRLGD